jgi:hypothetical protein
VAKGSSAPFAQKFGFETEALALDVSLFKPLRDAKRRWYDKHHIFSVMGLEHFRVFYELNDGRFVTVIYRDCFPDIQRRWFRKTVIWRSATRPKLAEVGPRTLVHFLKEWSMPVPEELEQHLLPLPPRPVRELSTWVGAYGACFICEHRAHKLDVLGTVNDIINLGISSVQEIRTWKRPNGLCARETTRFFVGVLLRQYKVDLDQWWGARDCVPPEAVPLAAIPWPAGYECLRDVLKDFVERFEGLLTVTTFWFPTEDARFPTGEEQIGYNQVLMDRLPDLEKHLGRLRAELDVARQAVAATEPEKNKKPPGKRPQEEEFLIDRIKHREGGTQDEIAKRFTEITHLPMSQGQVSRALANVKAWKEAGQAEPIPSDLHPLIYHTVDPRILDLGARVDSHTPRQRDRSSSE